MQHNLTTSIRLFWDVATAMQLPHSGLEAAGTACTHSWVGGCRDAEAMFMHAVSQHAQVATGRVKGCQCDCHATRFCAVW
jgi:hypothetical protein